MNPFKGANVTLILPAGLLIDVKTGDLDISNVEEAWFAPGGKGREKAYLCATSQSFNFAGVALNGGSPIPETYFGANGTPMETFENLSLSVDWGNGVTWSYTCNCNNVRFSFAGNALIAMSGTLKIVGDPKVSGSSSSGA